jgi:hypothetical protein
VLGPARYLGQLARSTVTRRRHEHDDADALHELEASPFELPAGLELEWLGVSGYRITFQEHTDYVDPFVSRVPLRSLLLRRPAMPDPAALAPFLPTTGRLVGHTHFDHAVDAPAVARRFGAWIAVRADVAPALTLDPVERLTLLLRQRVALARLFIGADTGVDRGPHASERGDGEG